MYCLSTFLCLSDWFECGKGPDPKVAKLDREMEAYRAAGVAADAPAADTVA